MQRTTIAPGTGFYHRPQVVEASVADRRILWSAGPQPHTVRALEFDRFGESELVFEASFDAGAFAQLVHVDADGQPDVVMTESEIAGWHAGNGRGFEGEASPFELSVGVDRVLDWIDFDEDGDTDVLVLRASTSDGSIAVYENDGQGGLSLVDAVGDTPTDFHAHRVFGRPRGYALAYTSGIGFGSWYLQPFEIEIDGSIAVGDQPPVGDSWLTAVDAVDRNGLLEFVVFDSYRAVHLARSGADWSVTETDVGSYGAHRGDFDGDGLDELFVSAGDEAALWKGHAIPWEESVDVYGDTFVGVEDVVARIRFADDDRDALVTVTNDEVRLVRIESCE